MLVSCFHETIRVCVNATPVSVVTSDFILTSKEFEGVDFRFVFNEGIDARIVSSF